MRSIIVITLLVACSGSKDPSTDADADADADADTDTDTDTDADTDTTIPATGLFDGTITGPSGPVAAAALRFCLGAFCRNGETDNSGAFVFEQVPDEWHSFEVIGAEGIATILVPLLFAVDEHRTLDLTAYANGAPSALGPSPAEHLVAPGLYVTVGQDDLEPPLFADPATEISGVRIPPESWVPVDGITGTVLAQWYVSPFDYIAINTAGLPVRIEDEWSTEEGASNFRVYTGSYKDSAWLDSGTATLSGGFFTGPALPVLSTVVLVQE